MSTCLGLTGCDPGNQNEPNDTTIGSNSATETSTVPLRIWIAGSLRQPETIVRQWNATSEQPIDIRALSVAELLAQDRCAADLLLYPSRLIGELLWRQWVDKLPSGLLTLVKPSPTVDDSDAPPPAPAALAWAAAYDGVIYGLPLGYSMINLFASSETSPKNLTWQQVKDLLAAVECQPIDIDESRINRDTLVDRFLSIAFGITKTNPKYGVLFNVRTLKSRLNASEFVMAGELLQSLACQPDAVDSVVGSHSAAWQWVNNQTSQAGFALLSPSHLSPEDSQLDSAQHLPLAGSLVYNDGSGILASVASQCQQTAQSVQFLRWIYQPRTLETLRGQVAGMVSITARGQTLIDSVVASNGALLMDDRLTAEPRMPGAELYRAALADQLLEFLRGNSKCPAALSAASEAWNRITTQQLTDAKTEYERSLGL